LSWRNARPRFRSTRDWALGTEHGTVKSRYGDPTVKYEAEIRKPERDKLVKELQDKIDQYQTKIDAHNATVEIEVPDAELP